MIKRPKSCLQKTPTSAVVRLGYELRGTNTEDLIPSATVFKAKASGSDGILRALSLVMDYPFSGSHDCIIGRVWKAGSEAYLEEVGYY